MVSNATLESPSRCKVSLLTVTTVEMEEEVEDDILFYILCEKLFLKAEKRLLANDKGTGGQEERPH